MWCSIALHRPIYVNDFILLKKNEQCNSCYKANNITFNFACNILAIFKRDYKLVNFFRKFYLMFLVDVISITCKIFIQRNYSIIALSRSISTFYTLIGIIGAFSTYCDFKILNSPNSKYNQQFSKAYLVNFHNLHNEGSRKHAVIKVRSILDFFINSLIRNVLLNFSPE